MSLNHYNEEGADISAYFKQPEPSEEGLAAVAEYKKKTETHILPIQYRVAVFDELKIRDVLCPTIAPYHISVVKAIQEHEVFVCFVNAPIGELTGKWLFRDDFETGTIAKLILD